MLNNVLLIVMSAIIFLFLYLAIYGLSVLMGASHWVYATFIFGGYILYKIYSLVVRADYEVSQEIGGEE
jgi:hypothetical protein